MPKGDREFLKADCEDGYTRIANLILEAIPLARLTGVQTGICLFLWRRSYGWNRAEDVISLREFAAACGTSRDYISKQLTILIEKNIIRRTSYEPGRTPSYAFTTSVAQWCKGCINVQGLHANAIQGLYNSATEGLYKSTTLNQELAPEHPAIAPPLKTVIKTIKEKDIYSRDYIQFQLAELLLAKILEHLPNYRKPDLQKWAEAMHDLLRLDKRAPEEVQAVILFAQGNSFWRATILSVDNLRKHYDRLNMQRTQLRAGPGPGNVCAQKDEVAAQRDKYTAFFK